VTRAGPLRTAVAAEPLIPARSEKAKGARPREWCARWGVPCFDGFPGARSQGRPVGGKPRAWQPAGSALAHVASAAREAPRCLTGAGRESDVPVETVARSEAGDDGRLQSRRPGAGFAEKGTLPRPLAPGASASRLKEAARASSGGRRRIADPSSLPRDRRKREAAGRPRDRTAAGASENRSPHRTENASPGCS